ncbi:MAG: hypothetical protein ACLQVN_01310 [Bryobacteraceae bacterium]
MMPEHAGPDYLQNRWVQLSIMVLSMVTLSNMRRMLPPEGAPAKGASAVAAELI